LEAPEGAAYIIFHDAKLVKGNEFSFGGDGSGSGDLQISLDFSRFFRDNEIW
jgi:hypothetical protein